MQSHERLSTRSKQIPVEIGFTFYYTDKRLKYTSKDFGIKSIPYGEGDDAEADALPAYEDEHKFTIVGTVAIILLWALVEIMFYVSHH